MTRIFSQESQLRSMTRLEWALTCALEKNGLAESGSGDLLEPLLDAGFVDVDSLVREAKESGNIAIPFVRQLTAAAKTKNELAARAIHLGATSQDVLDTALVLQMKDAFQLLYESIERLDRALAHQVQTHRETMLTGRTWLQPGPPTTLGLKLAGTLSALRRSRDRLSAAAHRALVLQFGGAVGTLASLGTKGADVSRELARTLELFEPDLPWHTQRDNLTEIVQVLATLTGTLAKFAGDIALLMQYEVSEAGEATVAGRAGSSTMPHKHNPVACAALRAIHSRMPGLAATMLYAMPQEHERGLGLWQAEWETVPEAFRLTAAALAYAVDIASGLTVDAARMRSNLESMHGLPLAEAVNAALAPKVGRSTAHELLQKATQRAIDEKRNLADVLKETPEFTTLLGEAEIDQLLDPRAYLGSAQTFIARVLREADAGKE
jgi:3-carboxy-cis,cis-muconate cycloisomerase